MPSLQDAVASPLYHRIWLTLYAIRPLTLADIGTLERAGSDSEKVFLMFQLTMRPKPPRWKLRIWLRCTKIALKLERIAHELNPLSFKKEEPEIMTPRKLLAVHQKQTGYFKQFAEAGFMPNQVGALTPRQVVMLGGDQYSDMPPEATANLEAFREWNAKADDPI